MTVTTSPLVNAYLADLDRALAAADPGDRAEIVDAVREHIDSALADLGAAPSQAEIAGVLRRLGSADAVASAWSAGERTTSPWAAASATPAAPSGPPIQAAPPHSSGYGMRGYAPPYGGGTLPAAAPMPTWAKVLLILAGVFFVGPMLLGLLGAAFLLPIRTAPNGFPKPLWWLLAVVVVGGTVAAGVRWRRSRQRRRAWLAAFVVGIVLTLVTAYLGVYSYADGRAYDGGVVQQSSPVPVEPMDG